MYTQLWLKYLPVIRILLKKAPQEEQTLQINLSDFERASTAKKSAFKFSLVYTNGKVDNTINVPALAKNLSEVLMDDAQTKEIFSKNDFRLSMKTKCQLLIQHVPKPQVESVEEPTEEVAHTTE